MNSYFFILNTTIVKVLLVLSLLWFFSMLITLYISICVFFFFFFLFKKKKPLLAREGLPLDVTCLFTPASGRIVKISESENTVNIKIKIAPWDHYGVYMPVEAEVINYTGDVHKSLSFGIVAIGSFEVQTSLRSESLEEVKLSLNGASFLRKPYLYIRSGDRARVNTEVGYLPFGGNIVIEFPGELNILVKEGDKVVPFETILAKL